MIDWPAGLLYYAELDSTNEEARRLALSGEYGPVWITAARQTAGRGRHGRQWQSSEGNLFVTLLVHPGRPRPEWAQLSFAAAIAVSDLVARFAPSATIAVKWPNDVLLDGRKVAGILLETVGESLAIGMGVNLASHPEGTEFPAISLAALGAKPPSADDAMALLAPGFAGWYDIWEQSGFAPIRDAWLARAAGLGGRIRARLPAGEHAGVFEGIDEQGALMLREAGSLRTIAAGEVFFG